MSDHKFFRSELAERLLNLEGKPFSLQNYPFYNAIYDGNYKKTLLKTARQVAKSTTLSNFMITESIGTPFFKNYYISPSQEQTRRFSHTRISKTLNYSPEVRKAFLSDSIDNVYLRLLKNGSEMAFTYASEDADRARGYSADRTCFDEVQSMLYDKVIPVVEESMANSNYAYSFYCGTPLTMENTIEYLWGLSTQTEWVMPCSGCSKYTFIVTDSSLGKYGPECLNCRQPLNPRLGVWVDMKPDSIIKGFHISQPIMPENVPAAWISMDEKQKAQERWERIITKKETYGQAQFDNEVLGVSNAVGARLLNKEELEGLCDERVKLQRLPTKENMQGISDTFGGVDWCGGSAEIKGSEGAYRSRTVLHVYGSLPNGKLKTLFYKIFPQGHATGWIDEISAICGAYGCKMVFCDAGEGYLGTALLKEKLGAHRVFSVRYSGSASKPIQWKQETMNYTASRTTLMDSYALFLKQGRAIFAQIQEMQPAISDILNIYEEVTISGQKVWRHSPASPDDCFHAQLFAWLAYKAYKGDLQFYT